MYLRPKGYSVVTDGWGLETRRDTYTCVHCQRVCDVEPGNNPSDFTCRACYQPVCPTCYGKKCDHFEKKLDRAEATDVWLRERFGEKIERAVSRSELRAITTAMAKAQMLRDMGLV